jgi:hypothetical protein
MEVSLFAGRGNDISASAVFVQVAVQLAHALATAAMVEIGAARQESGGALLPLRGQVRRGGPRRGVGVGAGILIASAHAKRRDQQRQCENNPPDDRQSVA